MTMAVEGLTEEGLLIRRQTVDHFGTIERAADAIRRIVERSTSQQRHSSLQCICELSAASEQLDQMCFEIATACRRCSGVKTRCKGHKRVRVAAAAEML